MGVTFDAVDWNREGRWPVMGLEGHRHCHGVCEDEKLFSGFWDIWGDLVRPEEN